MSSRPSTLCVLPVQPVMFVPQAAARNQKEILVELQRRGFELKFFSDGCDWPRIGKPKSLRQAFKIAVALVRGNRDLWKAARYVDFIYVPILTGLYFSFCAALRLRFSKRKVIYSFMILSGCLRASSGSRLHGHRISCISPSAVST